MLSFNVEGLTRNKHYLSHLLNTLSPRLVFLQEIWLPYSEQNVLQNLHPEYSFKIATPEMPQHPEDILTNSGPVWHGVAIGWSKDLSANILPI